LYKENYQVLTSAIADAASGAWVAISVVVGAGHTNDGHDGEGGDQDGFHDETK